ncbi:uncharacterized protein JCM10292_001313 [Rhodotorula paludigena]|uniref:uncharacterized protein n=1 Tax=Rhodotorula paludigena TaxID=86838 RepID=UPI00316E3356
MERTNKRSICVRKSANGQVVATRVVFTKLPGLPSTSELADNAAKMCEMVLFQPWLNAMGGGIILRSSLNLALALLVKQRGAGAQVIAVVHVTAPPPLNKRGGVALSQRLLNAQLKSILCADFLDKLKDVEGQFIDLLPTACTTSTDVKLMSMSKTNKKDFKRCLQAVLESNDPLPTVLVVLTALFATNFAPHIPSTGGSCPVIGLQVYLVNMDGLLVPVIATRHPCFANQACRAELRLPILQTYALAALPSHYMANCKWTTLAQACKHQVIATFRVERQEVLDNIAHCFTHVSLATSRLCMTSYPSPPIALHLKTAAQTIRVLLFFSDRTSQIADWLLIAPFFRIDHNNKRVATVTGTMTVQLTINADGAQCFGYGCNDATNHFKVNNNGLCAAQHLGSRQKS